MLAKVDPDSVALTEGHAVEQLSHLYRCFRCRIADYDSAEGTERGEGI